MKFRLRHDAEIDVLNAAELTAQIDRLVKALEAPAKPRWLRVVKSGPQPDSEDEDGVYRLTLDLLRVKQGQEFRMQRLVVVPSPDATAQGPSSGNGLLDYIGFQVLRDGVIADLQDGVAFGPGYLIGPGKIVNPEGAAPVFRNGELVQVQIFGIGYQPPAMTAVMEGSLHLGAA